MKKLLTFTFLLIINNYLLAQRQGGVVSTQVAGGVAKDGLAAQLHTTYYLRGYSNLTLNGRINYTDQNLPTEYNEKMNLKQFGFSLLVGWSPENFLQEPFFINIAAGGTVGYDYGNNGKPIFSDYEIPFDAKKYNKLTYGFVTSLQGEIAISDKLSFVADFSQYYRFKSLFGKSTYTITGGLVYYINN